MVFWFQVVLSGLIGAAADVVLQRWAAASGLQLKLWLEASVAILIFASFFGLTIRKGLGEGQPLSIVVMVVLLVNIGALIVWDSFAAGVALSPLQWTGFGLGLLTAACFELG